MEAKIRPNQTTNKDKFLGAWIIGTSCQIGVRSFISEHSEIKIIWVLFCPTDWYSSLLAILWHKVL